MMTGLLIDNQDTPAINGKVFERKKPVNDEVVTTAAAASADDVNQAISAAFESFKSWSQTGPNARRTILNKCADTLEARAADFAELGSKETGGIRPWLGFNVKIHGAALDHH